jgi:hypothetical protein
VPSANAEAVGSSERETAITFRAMLAEHKIATVLPAYPGRHLPGGPGGLDCYFPARPDGVAMTIVLALLTVLIPASVTLVGYWLKRQAEMRLAEEQRQSHDRLAQEQKQSERRLTQEQDQENHRLRLDAAMRAADLFGSSDNAAGNAARSASALLALTRLDFSDLAIALLVDLWSAHVSARSQGDQSLSAPLETKVPFCVSTETAIQVINAALESRKPDAQLMAAELLCRKAGQLDITNSLHWPSSVNSAWIPELPVTAKLLIVDALVRMALAAPQSKNALRELAVRLYGISAGDPEPRVKGCIGTLMKAVLPAVRNLGYTDFMKGPGHGLVTIRQMEEAAEMASKHPDGYFETIVEDRSERLENWSRACTELSTSPGVLATASCALTETAPSVR